MSGRPGLPRLKDVPGVQFQLPAEKLETMRPEIAEGLFKRSVFSQVHPACATCPQATFSINKFHSDFGNTVIARARCIGQPDVLESDFEKVEVSSALSYHAMAVPTTRIVKMCPDEAIAGKRTFDPMAYRGARADMMILDEMTEWERDAARFTGMQQVEPEPKPEVKKYDNFGDW